MTLTMTLWNAISDEKFYGYERVEVVRVPQRDERIHDLFGVTLQKPKGYNRWVVARVVWTFIDCLGVHDEQHADVHLVPEL